MPRPANPDTTIHQLIIKQLEAHLKGDRYATLEQLLAKRMLTVQQCDKLMADTEHNETYTKLKHFIAITNQNIIDNQLLVRNPEMLKTANASFPAISFIVDKFTPLDSKQVQKLHKKAKQQAIMMEYITNDDDLDKELDFYEVE